MKQNMRSIKAKERPGWDQITLWTIHHVMCTYMKLRFRYEQ